MTSEQLSDNNAIEVSGINMEIMLPDPTAIAIPENRAGITPPIKFYIDITNNTSMSFRFNLYETLIPELVTSEGQALQRQLVNEKPKGEVQPNRDRTGWAGRLTEFISNLKLSQECNETREINYLLVEPRESKSITINASLAWEDNLLVLKISTILNEFAEPIDFHNFWLFEALLPGNYQIRFIYQHNCVKRVIPEIDTLEITNVEEEDITFFPETEIFGLWEEQFGLRITTENGDILIFEALTLETYQVRLTYSSKQAMVKIYESVKTYTTLDVWSGQISTPFVDFTLSALLN